jgi:hypothetical protein
MPFIVIHQERTDRADSQSPAAAAVADLEFDWCGSVVSATKDVRCNGGSGLAREDGSTIDINAS